MFSARSGVQRFCLPKCLQEIQDHYGEFQTAQPTLRHFENVDMLVNGESDSSRLMWSRENLKTEASEDGDGKFVASEKAAFKSRLMYFEKETSI